MPRPRRPRPRADAAIVRRPARHAVRIVPAALLLAAGACRKPVPAPAAAAAVAVLGPQDVARAARLAVSPAVVLTGSLNPYRTAEVKAQVAGLVGQLRTDRGRPVRRGDLLAVLRAQGVQGEASGARAAVDAAQAQVALTRWQLESARQLYQAGAMAEMNFRNAQAQYAAAQGQLGSARAQAAGANEAETYTRVEAPLTGVVSARMTNQGEAVSPGQQLFTVVNADTLELAGQIPVRAAGQVRVGQVAIFSLDAYPGQKFSGRVARVDPTVDPGTRRVGASLYLPNPGHRIVGGQYVTGEIVSGAPAEDAVVVPQAAVRGGGDSVYVFVIEQGALARRAVSLGARDDGRGVVAVRSGVREGESVIVSPATDLAAGTRVRVANVGPAVAAREGK
ncbi:MexH family multidrug efflux RND transporter periplasmic adaptor subunit [Gemmatimonadetes bacterium T265]|nr:MexH family multidrug efflux RND transporter periplasmic adaptor subunit [Gemmatimonadetes bacterium T265]